MTLKFNGFKAKRNFHTILIFVLFQKYEMYENKYRTKICDFTVPPFLTAKGHRAQCTKTFLTLSRPSEQAERQHQVQVAQTQSMIGWSLTQTHAQTHEVITPVPSKPIAHVIRFFFFFQNKTPNNLLRLRLQLGSSNNQLRKPCLFFKVPERRTAQSKVGYLSSFLLVVGSWTTLRKMSLCTPRRKDNQHYSKNKWTTRKHGRKLQEKYKQSTMEKEPRIDAYTTAAQKPYAHTN